ncbi:MAG: electron transport complex subunit RsxE [Spirochaeta sp. LUC14_002_19_P3]|nr:MAG: electron transport complex subunit RsxE [Spirochaeta sp. LUC14_002_19_P3]
MGGTVKKIIGSIIKDNPILMMGLGLCPSLAVSTTVNNALGMSAATFMVLLGSNIVISALRKQIPDDIHIPAYIVIIATFVTLVDMLMQAYLPQLSKSLGIFIPLIVVNCIILGRAESFASKNSVSRSIMDALVMGLGFAIGLTAIALVREVLGAGRITLGGSGSTIKIPGLSSAPALVFVFPPGALIVLGFLQALFRRLGEDRPEKNSEVKK